MSKLERVAWLARHFTRASMTAVEFRDSGNIEAARHTARNARQDYADLQRLLGSESANTK